MLIAPVHPSLAPAARPPVQLRRYSPMAPRALLVGASTGGPQALETIFSSRAAWLQLVPAIIVLHMPADLVQIFARHIQNTAHMPARIAENGDKMRAGTIYFAPGDQHLRLGLAGKEIVLVHSDGPPQHFCKPAVDVLFRSAAKLLGPEALGLVLTGMGRDGLAGSQAIIDNGGSVIVQDEATSTVWGMPGAVAREGLASAMLPLAQISSAIGGLLIASGRSRSA